jgi:hypothetical protein
MPRQVPSESPGERTHQAAPSSELVEHQRLCIFQSTNRCTSGHGREVVEKFVESLPRFQVLEKGLKRNAGATENGGPPSISESWVTISFWDERMATVQ